MEPQRGSRLCLNSGGLECRACGMWCVGVCGRCVTVRGPTGRWKTMHLYFKQETSDQRSIIKYFSISVFTRDSTFSFQISHIVQTVSRLFETYVPRVTCVVSRSTEPYLYLVRGAARAGRCVEGSLCAPPCL